MKRLLLLLLPLLALTLNSCKKENKEGENNGKYTKLVKTVTIENNLGSGTFTLYYDSQNRLIKYGNNGTIFDIYKYSTNTITYNTPLSPYSAEVAEVEYTLDNNGNLVHKFENFPKKNISEYTYENGLLKTKKTKFFSHEFENECSYFWVNGNMTFASGKWKDKHPWEDSAHIRTYEINAEYSNKENLLNINIVFGDNPGENGNGRTKYRYFYINFYLRQSE